MQVPAPVVELQREAPAQRLYGSAVGGLHAEPAGKYL